MTTSKRRVRATLLLLRILIILILSCFYGNEATNCVENEKQALLTFKHDLTDPSNRLSSWIDGVDCCEWFGVVCNNITGHVTELRLKGSYGGIPRSFLLSGSLPFRINSTLGGSLNPSLLHLQQLQVLDLSMNNFSGVRIPSFIGSIHSLRHLNLSWAGFQGVIPHQLGNLSNLQSLNAANFGMLRVDNIQWLADLSNLERLDMSRANLSEASNWLQVINMIPSLTELHLAYCSLSQMSFITDFNLSSLTVLDLSLNGFTFPMLRWIFDLRKLVSLDLSDNYFEGHMPEGLRNLTSLNYLGMSSIGLNGTLPRELLNLSSLAELQLSANELIGTIPDTIGKLCNMNVLSLSYNKLEGLISDVIDGMVAGCFSYAIQSIYLEENQFSGKLTNKVGQFKNLINLSLNENKLNGTLPHSLGQLSKLEFLDISYNKMEGIVTQNLLENLTSLKCFYASGNSMTLEVDQNWVPPTQIEALGLRSWKLGPQFPNWIQSLKNMSELDLSFTGISGAIPSWIWSLNMVFLNFSHNQLQGEISIVRCFHSIDLSSNQLSGQLPYIASKGLFHLDFSNNSFSGVLSHFLCDHQMDETREMSILRLGNNLLSGEISDCWMNWSSLVAISLDNNNLTGSIPKSIGRMNQLRFLHLRNNSLFGGIPSSLENCTSLQVIDLAENKFDWNIPIWLGLRLLNLRILILRSNKFQGGFTPELCHLTSLQVLDVANNILSGVIPSCVNNFTSMVRGNFDTDYYWSNPYIYTDSIDLVTKGNDYGYGISLLQLVTSIDLSNNNFSGEIPNELTFLLGLISLNLSSNQLGGMIPMHIGKMVQLESLDLSRNQLSGSIPPGISRLSFLSSLNLSYNNLSGEIPLSTQMQTFNASCFAANKLCGRPLLKNCTNDDDDDGKTEIEEDAEDGVDLLYIFMGSGFVVGFLSICFTLILKKSWRYAYFRFVDEVWFNIYFSTIKYLFKR